MAKRRLDALLAERGLFESRSRAAASVMAGEVRIGADGRRAEKPGQLVDEDAELARRRAAALRLARRHQAGQRARRRAGSTPTGRRCLDVGRVDRRLHRLPAAGRARPTSSPLDVAYGELAWAIRTDPRVTVLERTNARSDRRRRCSRTLRT